MQQLIVDLALLFAGLLGFGFGLVFWFLVLRRVIV